ncbi:MAG: hypothetical protein R6V67_11740, partial [Spirochaetia bacterium]
MKALGIFEIKTKRSQICNHAGSEVWEARNSYLSTHDIDEDYQEPERSSDPIPPDAPPLLL